MAQNSLKTISLSMESNNEKKSFLERDEVPMKLKKAHYTYIETEAFPESTALLTAFKNDPERDQKIIRAVHDRNPAAMMLMARMMANNNDAAGHAYWVRQAYDAGSAEAAFVLGQEYESEYPYAAYQVYKVAMERGHKFASLKLVNLCNDNKATDLQITQSELDESLRKAAKIGDAYTMREAFLALRTGTHPVQFISEHGYPWGTGSFFIAAWKGRQFAITAHHVLEASNATPDQANLLVPGFVNPVPCRGSFEPNVGSGDKREDDKDILLWELDMSSSGPVVEWWAWRMEWLWKPATSLEQGAKVYTVGYPNVDNKYDLERKMIRPQPLIIRGDLGAERLGKGIFTIDCAEFSVDVDGISGGPVFSLFDGIFHFVGMAIRGGRSARKIHFLDATYIINALDRAITDKPS